MATYVVMEPPAGNAAEAAERAVILRDGFAFLAFLVPPLWLLWHRLWLEAILAVAAGIALTSLGELAGFGLLGAALSLLVSIFVGLEGQALRIARLRRRGWREWGVVEAGNRADAEIRYLAGGEPDEAAAQTVHLPASIPAQGRSSAAPALGLLGYPGRR